MSNHPTLPFGFTEHDGKSYVPIPNNCNPFTIVVRRDGKATIRTYGYVMNYFERHDSLPDPADVIGYFNATSAQLAALPSLLEMARRLSNAYKKDVHYDKFGTYTLDHHEVGVCCRNAQEIMRKIGGE